MRADIQAKELIRRILGLTKIFTSKEKLENLKNITTMDFLRGKDWLSKNGTKSNAKIMIFGNVNEDNKTDFFPANGEIKMDMFRNYA